MFEQKAFMAKHNKLKQTKIASIRLVALLDVLSYILFSA